MNTFKAGDKVYCPMVSLNVLTVENNCMSPSNFPLKVVTGDGLWESFTAQGLQYKRSPAPIVFHATEETHKKLCDFYGVEFEKPHKRKEAKEIIQAMLDDSWVGVPCYVSDVDNHPSKDNRNDFITNVSKAHEHAFCGNAYTWKYATPFDPKTGKVIIDYVDGQMIL